MSDITIMLMHFVRRATLALTVTLLSGCLLWFGLLLGVERLVGTPTPLKQALKDSGAYNTVINDALKAAQKQQDKGHGASETDIPVNSPEVRTIINDSFPPAFLQAQTEGALDSLYNWLGGSTPTLAFSLDLGGAKTRLASGVETYVRQRLSNLPACTAHSPPAATADPFAISCVPPGFDIANAAAQAKQQILGGEFLQDTTFNAEDLKDQSGRPVTEQYKSAPDIYQGVKKGVYALGIVALLMAVAAIFLSAHWRAGLRKLAIVGVSVGSILTALSLLLGYGARRVAEQFATRPESSEPLQQTLMRGAQLLAGDLRAWWLGFGLTLLILGIGGLIALHFTKPKQPQSASGPIDPPLPHEAKPKAAHSPPEGQNPGHPAAAKSPKTK